MPGWTPEFIVVDYETAIGDLGSTEAWHPDFRVVSMAASWRAEDGSLKSDYVGGETAVDYFLEKIAAAGIPVVAHNVQFEMLVTSCRFPQLYDKLNWYCDTMRLTQNYDNGGDAFAMALPSLDAQLDAAEAGEDPDEPEYVGGLSLVNACRRILNEPDHKREAYGWLRANIAECRPGREGQFLTRLPRDLFVRYNVADTEATLRLYEFLVHYYDRAAFDWRFDHGLYLSSVRRIVGAKVRGVRVDREALSAYAEEVELEIVAIGVAFRERFDEQIRAVERLRLLDAVRERKTLRGRRNFVRRYRGGADTAVAAVRFNPGSNKQLESLFVGQLGLVPQFLTDKGSPSFRSAHLSQWGDGGDMLRTRRKRLLVLKQCQALLSLSAVDGRWHMDLRAAGTATGRYAGGTHGG